MTIRSIVTALAMALLLMPAAPASAQQAKCLAGKTNCMAKKAAGLLQCEALAVTPGKPADPNAKDCVTKVVTKFDGGLQPAKGCFAKVEAKDPNDCLTVDDTGAAETAVDTCVAALVAAIDPTPLDQTKCAAGKMKCVAKYLAALLKCRKVAQTPGKPTDPNTKGCVDKAVAKYTGGVEPTKGCFAKREAKDPNDCQIPGDSATLQGLAADCVDDLVAVVTCAGEPDGTACNDGNACTTADACQGGTCTGAAPVICEFPGQCQNAGSCDPATGQCSYPPKANGTTCNDGNACTVGDACQAGSCVSGSPISCPPRIFPTQCHQLVQDCNPANGQCVARPSADGTACDDGNSCTTKDSCQAGVCTGAPCGPGRACCSTDAPCVDIGSDSANCGACGNMCTNSVCLLGQCYDGCVISGVGYPNGVRNPGNDCEVCDTSFTRTAWSALGGSSAFTCTIGCFHGFCFAGACGGLSPTPTGGVCGSASTCVSGTCNQFGVCVRTAVNEGQSCTPLLSKSGCTGTTGTCKDGDCIPVATNEGGYCLQAEPAPDPRCRSAVDGTCNEGTCIHDPLPDHTPCTPPNQCHTGECLAGTCHTDILPTGTPCTLLTGDKCRLASCGSGLCQPKLSGATKSCPDKCGDSTTCDSATGMCEGSPPSFGKTSCGGTPTGGRHPEACCPGQVCMCPPNSSGIPDFCFQYGCWNPADIPGRGGPVGGRPG
jgi:hypothetical protein